MKNFKNITETLYGDKIMNKQQVKQMHQARLDIKDKLEKAGFERIGFGEMGYTDESGLKIIAYKTDGWSFDIYMPNGITVSLDQAKLTVSEEPLTEIK